jgi:hypothetical protein
MRSPVEDRTRNKSQGGVARPGPPAPSRSARVTRHEPKSMQFRHSPCSTAPRSMITAPGESRTTGARLSRACSCYGRLRSHPASEPSAITPITGRTTEDRRTQGSAPRRPPTSPREADHSTDDRFRNRNPALTWRSPVWQVEHREDELEAIRRRPLLGPDRHVVDQEVDLPRSPVDGVGVRTPPMSIGRGRRRSCPVAADRASGQAVGQGGWDAVGDEYSRIGA